MAQTNQQSISGAQSIGLQSYRLILTQWGNLGTGGDSTSRQSMIIPSAIAGIAIDPNSLVTECRVRTNIGVNVTRPDLQIENFEDEYYLRADTPLFMRLAAPVQLFPTAATQYKDSFQTFDQAPLTSSPFGGALGPSIFTSPTLTAILFFDQRPAVTVPGVQPFQAFDLGNTVTAAESLIRVFPVRLRRRIRLTFTAGSGSNINVRISGVIGQATEGMISINTQREYNLATLTVPAGQTATTLIENPGATFLNINAARAVAGSSVILTDIIAE